MSEKTCSLNYEAEYERLRQLCDKQRCELRELDERYRSMESEFVRMRAQLDIVYLIFGKRC